MHVEISFMEMVTLLGMLIGAAWLLLKLSARQYDRALETRFTGLEGHMKARDTAQDKKFDEVKNELGRIHALETRMLERHAEYLDKFAQKEDMKTTLNRIFDMLREISDKISDKVDRKDCDSCRRQM